MNELESILQFYDEIAARGARAALATVIKTAGPSYRSPGARSLICEDGTFRGGLSAGCLEADIACRLDGGMAPFVVTYDLSSADDIRGFPFGCGGSVEILVEPIESSSQLDLLRWLLTQTEPVSVTHSIPGGGSFVEHFEPAIDVTIFGDGDDAHALAEFAAAIGINVQRVTRNQLRSKDCQSVKRKAFNIVMTHDLNLDAEALAAVLESAPRYLGVMGPRSRTERLLNMLSKEHRLLAGETEIYAPIGLDMRAETPREIALSILAEIQTLARSRKPAHLRDVQGAIHERQRLHRIAAAILAAGGSTRFGSSKQLAHVGGETLIERAQRVLLESAPDCACVILGCNAGIIGEFVSDQITTVSNADWQEGISSSVRAAVKFAQKEQASHLLVTLCDQPLVTSQLIERLLNASREHPDSIIACDYGQGLGVPAVFPRAFFEQLLALRGDRGAKSIIAQAKNKVTIQFSDGLVDIDCAADLAGLCP